jgi:hypothetical protein
MATRAPAVASAPNSTAPMRMNKNDEPQMAANKVKSSSQGAEVSVVAAVVFKDKGYLRE